MLRDELFLGFSRCSDDSSNNSTPSGQPETPAETDDADSDLEEPSEEPAEEATNSIPMTLQGEPVDRDGIDWTFWRGPASNRISSETGLVDGWDPNGIVR